MIDDRIRLSAHLPSIAIVPAWKDEWEVFRKLVWPAGANTIHNLIVEKLITDRRQVKAYTLLLVNRNGKSN